MIQSKVRLSNLGRFCYAGYHIDETGQAFDFAGICDPGPTPAQASKRICDVPFYQHPNSWGVYYDEKGFCDPTYTRLPNTLFSTGVSSWVWYALIIGGIGIGGYLLYEHYYKKRKRKAAAAATGG